MYWKERCKQIFEQEIAEFQKIADNIGDEINLAIEMIYACTGKIVIMGIGKTGIVGHKIAASLASTGTPAIFVNAAEAMHGDLGMVAKGDIALLISHSGTSAEIINICAPLKNIGARIIAITGNPHSTLAQEAEIVLNVAIEREVCPLNLAPTTSTTATMLLGDALMVCLMERRQFKAENFALYHPGGALGRQLLSRVKHRMSTTIPRVMTNTLFNEIIYTVTEPIVPTGYTKTVNVSVSSPTPSNPRVSSSASGTSLGTLSGASPGKHILFNLGSSVYDIFLV